MFYMVATSFHSVLSNIIGVCYFVRDHRHNTFDVMGRARLRKAMGNCKSAQGRGPLNWCGRH